MFPYTEYTYYGIHVKEQIQSIEKSFNMDDDVYFINGRKSKIAYFTSIIKVNLLLLRNRFDLIHVHFGLSGLFLLFNPFINTPVILTLHGSDINTDNKFVLYFVKKMIHRADHTIVMSKEMYDKVKVFTESVDIIPCGIDMAFFKEGQKVSSDILKIGFPGNPERPEKNYPLFSKVINLLKERGYKVEEIIFHDLSREEVVNKLNQINVLVLTSFNEGSPQIIKEALGCNTPIVSVPVGDVAQVLANISNCRVIKNHDPKNLIMAVKEILELPINEDDNGGRKRLMDLGLDQDAVASNIYNLYMNLVK